ncbi:hypothetical protein ACM37_04730 [Helicobacter pylori]|uniref:hypothetical protein n=1 Tax=Helicobacter pylori TaxID=210 RepID=UPI00068165E8|nr:hypothetical protein [Helicobacter pylori]KNE23679.1 hypothetical protein ACM37_04730 [Helicobacter pylori]
MKIISFENDSVCDGHLLIPCRIYCVELEIGHNDLGLNAIERCALKLKELGVKDKELKDFLGFGGELDLLEPILEKIETKTLEEYKKIHAHFYYNLINQEFLHFVDLERVRTIDGKKLNDNIVEFSADPKIKAESLYYPKENNKSLNVNDIIIRKTIETSIKYHQQNTLRHAKVVAWHDLKGDYYLHAKAFDDGKEIRVECKNHPIEKMAEKLLETNPIWFEKWKKKQYTQTGESKPSKRIKVFKKPTAFDDRLHTIEHDLKNLSSDQKKLEICGALHDIYEQIFDETPSLKGHALETYRAEDLSKKFMRLGFERIPKGLNDFRLNALLRYEKKVMQALAKNYPSFLQDLHDIKKYRNKDKHGEKSQDGFSLTRGELERYRDGIYFLVENLLKNPLIKERENAQEEKHEEKYYKKNAEIDARSQLSNLNAPKSLFECFVGVNLAKAKYYSKKEEREKEKMILNFCKIFEIILFEAIQKQPKLNPKTKDELLEDYPGLGNSLREVREDFLKRAFEYNKASLGAYVLVLLSCKYFESVFEEVQEWLDFIARLIALRGHPYKIAKELESLKEEDLKKLEKQAL